MKINLTLDQSDVTVIVMALEEAENRERDCGRDMTANMVYGARQRLLLAVKAAVDDGSYTFTSRG